MSDAPAVAAPHVVVGVSGCLHGDAAACHQLEVGRARKAVEKHGVYHVPHVHEPKVPLLVASVSCPPILCRESLQNDDSIALVVHRLFHFLEKFTLSVQDET